MGFLDRLRQAGQQPAAPAATTASSTDLDLHFAVLDVETTGLSHLEDRIIEIAVVIIDAAGVERHAWSTLVKPELERASDVGAVAVHGIQAEWLAAAPTFGEIAGDLTERLVGRVVVAHNTRFDMEFIEAEYKRLGLPVSTGGRLLDTMDIADQLGLPRKLTRLADHLGIDYFAHSALDDARVTAEVLAKLLPAIDPRTFAGDATFPAGIFPVVPATAKTVQRAQAMLLTQPRDLLSGAVADLRPIDVGTAANPEAAAAYLTLLEEAMEDGYFSPQERDQLVDVASRWGISADELDRLNREFLDGLIDVALADRKISKSERDEIATAATWLGIEPGDVELLVRQARARSRAMLDDERAAVRGRTVVFTGKGLYSNSIREGFCAKYGIVFRTTVNDGCDLVVVGADGIENATVVKARSLGVYVMVERAFWDRLGEKVPSASR